MPLNLRPYVKESKTRFYQLMYAKRVPLRLDRGVISISFDDVPMSAYLNAVPLLDAYGLKATFYVAVGLGENQVQSADGNSGEFISPREIKSLHKTGHEIGCHTYSHYPLKEGNAKELLADAKRNVSRLKGVLGDVPVEHFSYPFGHVSLKAKKLLSERYKTMRSSQPGVNQGSVDMRLLRSVSIYNPSFSKEKLMDVIQKTEAARGWLILYTHGVEQEPDNYGCTPEQFEWVLGQCAKSQANVMPVRDAYEFIISQQ